MLLLYCLNDTHHGRIRIITHNVPVRKKYSTLATILWLIRYKFHNKVYNYDALEPANKMMRRQLNQVNDAAPAT
jgi:hypothetical protein